MLPTPRTSHLAFNKIYEPAEDSFLLLDVLSSPAETSFLRQRFVPQSTIGPVPLSSTYVDAPRDPYSPTLRSLPDSPSATPLIVEVGTGSGVILAFLACNARTILGRHDVLCLGGDVNSHACMGARRTVEQTLGPLTVGARDGRSNAGVFLDCVQADLATSVRPGSVDLFVFNPPYVPSEQVPNINVPEAATVDTFAQESKFLALATDGGKDGMEVTWRALRQLPVCLSARGVAYVLFCKRNGVEGVMREVREWEGPEGHWEATVVGDSGNKAGWERLCVVRISRALAS